MHVPLHLRNQQNLQTKIFPPGRMVVTCFPEHYWVGWGQDGVISGEVYTTGKGSEARKGMGVGTTGLQFF